MGEPTESPARKFNQRSHSVGTHTCCDTWPHPIEDALCIAGGTGLAPIKAIVQQLTAAGAPRARNIQLFFGARQESDLYDLRSLRRMESRHPSLRVIPVVSDDRQFGVERGLLPYVVARHLQRTDHDVYVAGPADMIRLTVEILTAMGVPAGRISHDPIGTDG